MSRVAAGLLVSALLVATPLQAQITPSQSLQQRLQEDQLRLRLLELESDLRDDDQPLIRSAPDGNTPEQGSFQLKSLELSGDVSGIHELEQRLQPWIGTSIDAEDLKQIQETIAVWFWRRDQAVGSTIQRDPRHPGALTIRLAALELAGVEVDEAFPYQLSKRLAIGTVTAAVPLGTLIHPGKLESALLKLNDLWGVQVRGQLQPGPKANTRSLVLEITESVLMKDADRTIDTLNRLKAIGVQLAIDDFGTGYSSLSYLKQFPIDRLKIDRSFIKTITANADDRAIACAVIAMADNMKLKVTAEGVETVGQMNLLQQENCDEAQGFYISRPMPVEDAGRYLRELEMAKAS